MFAEMTLTELNALAERQRRQIEDQEKTLQAKQQRLNFLTQQSQQHGDNDRLRKLREKVMDQEDRLRLLRVGPEQNTALLSAELDSVRNLLESKQRELSNSMQKVEQLTHVLGELRKTQINEAGSGEVGKLNRELGALHSLNTDQSARLQSQRELLRRKQDESAELDRKILDLADRISKKRAAQSASGGQLYTNVAAVEPVVQNPNRPSKTDTILNKQTILNNITHRSEIAPDLEVDIQNPPARRDVKPSVDGSKKRPQRPISDLFGLEGKAQKQPETAKIRPQQGGNSQSSIFQYRNPPDEKNRPPPPSYHSAVNARRTLPGQASRGKLTTTKAPGSPTAEKSQVMFDEWRKRISNQPRPLKKRSSFSEAEGSGGPNMQRFYYQQLYQKSDPLFRFDPRNVPAEEEEEHSSQSSDSDPRNSTSTGRSNPIDIQPPPPKSPPKGPVTSLTKKFEQFVTDDPSDDYDGPPIPPPLQPPISVQDIVTKVTPKLRSKKVKGILKPQGAPRNNERRVQFDPLALLLDASLEGELDLVKKVIDKVYNPSSANDEGITALHNSVCAGYFDVVKFLVHWGVDINAADSDGWTPLHCAASCNSVQMVKFLVENGAQIFAETFSDHETAAEKCEELDEGYALCSDYLYGTQEKLGVINKGSVYTLFDYAAENADELSFKEGDLLTVQRRGDNGDQYWWWSRHSSIGPKEGYIPRNYLGMWPRIKPANQPDKHMQ